MSDLTKVIIFLEDALANAEEAYTMVRNTEHSKVLTEEEQVVLMEYSELAATPIEMLQDLIERLEARDA